MRKYLVVGIYLEDDYQRFADSYEAESPEDAERMAPEDVCVAGVVELRDGEMVVVA